MAVDIEAEVAGQIKQNLAAQDANEIQAEIKRQGQASFQSSMAAATHFEPAKFGQALQLQRTSGVPAKVAYDNWDKVDEIKQQDRLTGLFNLSPATAGALSNPELAIVAKGDEENLQRMEAAIQKSDFYNQGFFERQLIGPMRKWWDQDTTADAPQRLRQLDSITSTFDRVDAGEEVTSPWAIDYRAADAAGRKVMRDRASLQQNLALDKVRVAQRDLSLAPVDPTAEDFLKAEGVSGALGVIADDPMYLGRVAAESLPDMASSLVAGLINPLFGGVAEGMTASNYKFLEVLQEKGIDPGDTVQFMQALRDDDLLQEASIRSARYGAGIGAVSTASFGLLGRVLAPSRIGGKQLSAKSRELINAAAQVPAQGALEALGEATGQLVERGELSDLDSKEILLEGLVGGLMGGPEVGLFATKRFTNHMIQARRAERAGKLQGQLVQHSLDSSARKNDPASFEAIAGQQLIGQPNEFIEIPAAKLEELNQSGVLNIPELLENVGIDPDHYSAQVGLGGTIRMKNSGYLAYLADHDALLSSSVRVVGNDYSLEDVQTLDREMIAEMEKVASQFSKADPLATAYSDVMGQLLGVGYERAAADSTARQYAAVITRLAEQSGQTVEDIMAASPLTIGRQLPEQVRRIRGDELTLMLGRLRAGDVPKPADMFGKSLGEYLRSAGGLKDDGGELAAIDLDVGKVGRNKLIREDGKSLDDMAMQAWERGYFPGVARENVGPQLIVDALQSELVGTPRFSVEQENATLRDQADNLQQLQDHLDQLGVDLASMTDEEVVAMLRSPQEAGGRELNQQVSEQAAVKNLILAHNLSADNLREVLEIGGLPAPSLAITRADAPIEGFGEITLIGDTSLAMPSAKNPIFDADVYSPRFPDVKVKVDERQVRKAFDLLTKAADASGIGSRVTDRVIEEMQRNRLGNAIGDVAYDAGLRYGYLTQVKGEDFDIPMKAQEVAGRTVDARTSLVAQEPLASKIAGVDVGSIEADSVESAEIANALYSAMINNFTAEAKAAGRESAEKDGFELANRRINIFAEVDESNPEAIEILPGVMFNAPQRMKVNGLKRIADMLANTTADQLQEAAATRQVIDRQELDRKLSERVPDEEIRAWAREKLAPAMGEKRIVKETGRTAEYSLENIVKEMTKKVRDSEGFNYGLGNARSRGATKFKSLKQIQGQREKVKSKAETESAIEENKRLYDEILSDLASYHPGRGRGYGRSAWEVLPDVIGESYTMGVERALAENEFTDVPPDLVQKVKEFAGELLQLPTEYFEAKPQRAVDLSEFSGAVVPADTPTDIVQALIDAGLQVNEYDKSIEGARSTAVQKASNVLHAEKGSVLFQGDQEAPRGSISFPERKIAGETRDFRITIGKKHDLSTVLHELGHYYLEVIGDLVLSGKANEQLSGDYSTILDWLGADKDARLTVDQHEKFARGFELYLAEGKAPSIDLQSAFSRFKRWMIAVYKDLRRLDVELSPEVRTAFDRLLASDEAISEAQDAMALSERYESSILELMTDDERANYQRASGQARDEATQEIEQEILKAETQREKEWYREERRNVEREVRADLEESPPYQARKYLFGNAPHPELGRVLRMDTAAVTELFGTRSKEARFLGRARARENGVHPEIAASLLGYDNPVDMLTDMMSVPGLAEAIKSETDRIMAARHPDPRLDGSLSDKAKNAVGEHEAEVQAIQLRALARQAGRKATQHRIIKEAARQHIERLRLRDAVPYTFQRASTKAANAVEAALLDGNMPKAYEEKEKQLMNLHLYREAVKAQELAQQKRGQAKAYMKSGGKRTRLQKASVENFEVAYPDGRTEYVATKAAANRAEAEGASVTPLFNFLEQVDGLLAKYEFGTPRKAIRQQRESLITFLSKMADQHIVVNPPEWLLLDRAERTNWKELTIGELVDVVDMIRQIDQMAKNKLTILRGDKLAEFEPIRDALVASIELNASKARSSQFNKSFGDDIRRWGREWLGLLPADQIARELDGQDELGPVQENITTPVQVAGRQVVIREKAEHQGLADLLNQFYTPDQLRGMNDPSKLVAIPEIGDSMTRMQMVMLMANLGNDGNRKALLAEGRGIWTAESIQAVMGRLNKNDADFVEALWSWIDKFWPEVAENEGKRTGVVPEKVAGDPYPVKLADGSVRVLKGGYFPLKYDGDLSIKTSQDETGNAFKNMTAGRTAKAYTPDGHRNERVGSGGRPVKLDLSVVTGHVNEVVRDILMTDPVNQAWRFLHDSDVQGSFERSNLKELFTALEIWLQDTAEGEKVDSGYMTASARWLRVGFTANVMLFNIANSALNLAGTHPLVVLGKKWAMRGYREALRPASWDQMYELSSYMREARVDSFNKDLTMVQDQMKGKGGWRSALVTAGFYVHNKTQIFMDGLTWMGAYQKGMSLDLAGQDLVTYADQRVVEASGSGVFADRSALERGTLSRQTRQNELVRGLTTLAGYMIRKMAIARKRTGETNFTDITQALNWAVDMALLFTIEGLAFAAVKGNIPDDEDEPEEWAKTAAWETFASVGAGLPPFGRPIVSGIQGFGGGTSSVDIFAEQFGNAVVQAKQGDADVTAAKAIIALVGTATKTPGIATNRAIDWLDRANDGDIPPWYEIFTGNRNK